MLVPAFLFSPQSTFGRSAAVSGHVFFDFNGNSIQDAEEPSVSNVVILIGDRRTSTDESGFYIIYDLLPGNYVMSVLSPSNFKFICRSIKEVVDVKTGLNIFLPEDSFTTVNLGLTEGFLTLPTITDGYAEHGFINGICHTDLDFRVGIKRNYLGQSLAESDFKNGDQHQGVDFHANVGTPVYSSAPGKVILIVNEVLTDGSILTNIHLLHETGGRKFVTQYGHIKNFLVKEGDCVARGQQIAEVADQFFHLHFALWEVPNELTDKYEILDYIYKGGYPFVEYPDNQKVPAIVDPYRDITNPNSVSFWTKDNDPRCPGTSLDVSNIFVLKASAAEGGSVVPAGEINVKYGEDQLFQINPNEGYHIKEVIINGKSVGEVSTFCFLNITENYTIEAIFDLNKYIIMGIQNNGGTISPSGTVSVNYGDSKTFTITPNSGYKIKDVKVDGVSVGAVSTYTFTNITSDHKIEATFEKQITQTVIILHISDTLFTVNGVQNQLDSPPIIKNGRTLLPIRAVVEALGGTVSWNDSEKKVTVTLGANTIELWIGKSTAKVNGVSKPIDSTNSKVVPEIINSRTMLPLRFVTENLGCDVQWEETTKTITITYQQ